VPDDDDDDDDDLSVVSVEKKDDDDHGRRERRLRRRRALATLIELTSKYGDGLVIFRWGRLGNLFACLSDDDDPVLRLAAHRYLHDLGVVGTVAKPAALVPRLLILVRYGYGLLARPERASTLALRDKHLRSLGAVALLRLAPLVAFLLRRSIRRAFFDASLFGSRTFWTIVALLGALWYYLSDGIARADVSRAHRRPGPGHYGLTYAELERSSSAAAWRGRHSTIGHLS